MVGWGGWGFGGEGMRWGIVDMWSGGFHVDIAVAVFVDVCLDS